MSGVDSLGAADPRWVWAFLDRPADRFDLAASFWCAATASTLSTRRGAHEEFATFLPADGGAWLKLQGVDGPCQGGHLDLEVVDVTAATERARSLGAAVVADLGTLQVLRSPAGLLFCLVPLRSDSVATAPANTPGGLARADQAALDIGPAAFAGEVDFWAALTGWRVVASVLPEFTLVLPPRGHPVRLLLQRLDAEPADGPAMHLDLACSEVGAATAYHLSLGASVVAEHEFWTVMRDPAGGTYCLTARDPDTGRLPARR